MKFTKEEKEKRLQLFNKGLKKCSKCHEIKELSKFNKNKTNRDGLDWMCKECSKGLTREYQQKNKDKLNKYAKQLREKNPEKHKESQKKYRQSEKGKEYAEKARLKRLDNKNRKVENIYYSIRQRCNNPKHKYYNIYKDINVAITRKKFISYYNSIENCQKCGQLFNDKIRKETHRKDPKGDYTIENIRVLCGSCHAKITNEITRERRKNIIS